MDRRDVLKLGVGAVATAGSGCATLAPAFAGMTDGDMDTFLGRLDDVMGRLATEPILERFFEGTKRPVSEAPRYAQGQNLARKTLRSLFLVGTLRELPEERIAHPGVQQRLRDSMGEFDEAMFGMTDLLAGLSPEERGDVSKAFKEDPNLGMKLMGALDGEAAAWGVSTEGRLKLRTVSTQVTTRLKQSPDLFIEEYVGKMRKLAARHGAQEQAQRELATSVGEAMLWQGEQPAESEAAGGALTPPPPPPAEPSTPVAAPPQQTDAQGRPLTNAEALAERRRKAARTTGTVMLTAGGIALGVGAALFGISFATLNATGGVSIILATVGALVGIGGLIVLLIGLIVFLTSL